jgi:molybdopterin-guanine dinucleotide biosynthesis protein A
VTTDSKGGSGGVLSARRPTDSKGGSGGVLSARRPTDSKGGSGGVLSARRPISAGIFVGGASHRMGGRPKGWLLAPQDPAAPADPSGTSAPRLSVLERTVSLARGVCDHVCLVGRADSYARLELSSIPDAVTADGARAPGPLAGLVALLERVGDGTAIALACDMPYLTSAMLERLATIAPEAAAVAPREAAEPALWSPFFARYDAARVAAVARAKLEQGERSLRAVLESVDTRELPLSAEERRALRDWDSPADVDDTRT